MPPTSTDEVERLRPDEFVIDTGLRESLRGAGEARYAAVKERLQREMKAMEVRGSGFVIVNRYTSL